MKTYASEASGPIVYAAGSLKEAFAKIADLWVAQGRAAPTFVFGASGLLRQRIELGEPADVLASADTRHPQTLALTGTWQTPTVFTRNVLCALVQPHIEVTPQTLLATLLRSDVRVGTSTPVADPSGDYAFALFHRAEALAPGARAKLESKALQLTGSPQSPTPPNGRGTYAWLMDTNQADIFLTYKTNAVAAQKELPKLRCIDIPTELQVGAAYGLTVRLDAGSEAQDFQKFLIGASAQDVLLKLGFEAP
jgi:molybdate transport system substrate-binding protein